MQPWIWHFLDYFFVVFHTALIFFNVFGWIWKKTRLANFVTLALTGASWGLLGIFYGMGYCPLTDWHFQVLRHLNVHNLPNSYILYLFNRLTGLTVDSFLVDALTLAVFLIALGISVYVNFFISKKRKQV